MCNDGRSSNNLINICESEEVNLFRYAMVMEYIGSSYAGSQKQQNIKTVQSELENALKLLTSIKVNAIFSGRTDSGVNAKGQVVHFNLPFQIDEYKFLYSLNAILPDDISVISLKKVDLEFHSQRSALYRWYRYTINNRNQRSVWLKQAVYIKHPLNVEKMNKALGYLIGKHDFSSFKSANSTNPATVCTVYIAECKADSGIIHIDIVANRFLYNMVRIIAGTLLNIGKGNFPPEHMYNVLNSKDRRKAGPTARPEGLTFMTVSYGEKYNLLDEYNKEAMYYENIFCKAS